VGKGAPLRAVPTRGHVAGASARSFAHPTILRAAPQPGHVD